MIVIRFKRSKFMMSSYPHVILCLLIFGHSSMAQNFDEGGKLKISRLHNKSVEQELGDLLFITERMPSISPLRINEFWVSSQYGYRKHPMSGKKITHQGIDLAAPKGTLVYATADGKVKEIGFNKGYGHFIILTHHHGFETLYAHLSELFNKRGDSVYQGNVIAKVGNTGRTTGCHLHHELFFKGSRTNPIRSFGLKRKILHNYLYRIRNF